MKKHIIIKVNGLLIHVDKFSKTSNSVEIYAKGNYIGYFRTGQMTCTQQFISESGYLKGDKFLVYTIKED